MLIVAADTSTDWLSVALWRDGEVLAAFDERVPRRHSELLLTVTRDLLTEAGVALTEIDRFAITRGPGSFTGVRIGVSTWKGLACANEKPLVGVSTLEAMAVGAPPGTTRLCPMLDAKMAEVYAAVFEKHGDALDVAFTEQAIAPESLLDHVSPETTFLGDGALLYADAIRARFPEAIILDERYAYPNARSVAALARHAAIEVRDGVRPVYLRRSQAEELRASQGAAP